MDKSISNRIKSARLEKRLTQEQLSEKAKISVVQYSRIERGLSNFNSITLAKICKVLEVSPDYILFGKVIEDDDNCIHKIIKNFGIEKSLYVENIVENYFKL